MRKQLMLSNIASAALLSAGMLMLASCSGGNSMTTALPQLAPHKSNTQTSSIHGTFKEFALASNSSPTMIVEGPDGNLWFTEQGTGNIGRMTPSGTLTEFPVVVAGGSPDPFGITVGPDKNLWFTDPNDGLIGRITTGGTITMFTPPGPPFGAPLGITVGPNGNLWFVEIVVDQIGEVTTSGAFTFFPIPTAGAQMRTLTAGPDGNLWFTEQAANKIGKITTAGNVTEYVTAANSQPTGIVACDSIFFSEPGIGKIGNSTTSGTITELPIPAAGANPRYMSMSSDITWFGDIGTNALGKILPNKTVSETAPVPTANASPLDATVGPGGTVWFTEFQAGKIGVFTPS